MDEDQRVSDETVGSVSVRNLPERNADGGAGNDGLKSPKTFPTISITAVESALFPHLQPSLGCLRGIQLIRRDGQPGLAGDRSSRLPDVEIANVDEPPTGLGL